MKRQKIIDILMFEAGLDGEESDYELAADEIIKLFSDAQLESQNVRDNEDKAEDCFINENWCATHCNTDTCRHHPNYSG